ncbi:MAG TPA: hypothetical protein VGP62_01125 [Bryobacteraceae bacterium]|nr:hypothetical protein [Bryobacteraceae bacterium]
MGNILKKAILFYALVLCAYVSNVRAQVPAAEPSVTPAVSDKTVDPDNHRMFGVLPNFKTVNDPDQPIIPMDTAEKFQLVLHYFDPFTFFISSIQAGIEQATNEKESYGQGVKGYSKRYGADFTDAFTNELFVVGVFPTLLHEDPRYFRLGHGGGWHRTGYALSRILVARTDSGGHRFNYSEFLGNFTSGSISQLYYPQNERGMGGILTRMSVQIGYDALFNILKEFYPDLKRKFHKSSVTGPLP